MHMYYGLIFLSVIELQTHAMESINEFPTHSEDIIRRQKENRLFCFLAASASGLVNYPTEFWHFSTHDAVHAYYTEPDAAKRICHYDYVANNTLGITDFANRKMIYGIYALARDWWKKR